MQKDDHTNDGEIIIAVESSQRRRKNSRRRGGQQGKSVERDFT